MPQIRSTTSTSCLIENWHPGTDLSKQCTAGLALIARCPGIIIRRNICCSPICRGLCRLRFRPWPSCLRPSLVTGHEDTDQSQDHRTSQQGRPWATEQQNPHAEDAYVSFVGWASSTLCLGPGIRNTDFDSTRGYMTSRDSWDTGELHTSI